MSIASLFRPAPAPVAVPGGRHAAPETEERPVVALNPAPGRHAAPEDAEPALDLDLGLSLVVGADFDQDEDDDLLESLGFDYGD
jgi:hypothetical protein